MLKKIKKKFRSREKKKRERRMFRSCEMKKKGSVTLKKTKKWEVIKVKLPQCSFPSLLFLPIWEEKFCGPREKIFSQVFPSPYFPLIAKQQKTEFSTQFSFLYFPSPLKSTKPNTILMNLQGGDLFWAVVNEE